MSRPLRSFAWVSLGLRPTGALMGDRDLPEDDVIDGSPYKDILCLRKSIIDRWQLFIPTPLTRTDISAYNSVQRAIRSLQDVFNTGSKVVESHRPKLYNNRAVGFKIRKRFSSPSNTWHFRGKSFNWLHGSKIRERIGNNYWTNVSGAWSRIWAHHIDTQALKHRIGARSVWRLERFTITDVVFEL